MNSTKIGRQAESIVGEKLARLGYVIIAQNWRTRWCEIDLVAKKNDIIYFVEVKYRNATDFGDGLDAVGRSKLLKLRKAAAIWVAVNAYGGDYRILIVALSGKDYAIESLIELD